MPLPRRSRGPRHHPSPLPALQAGASETPKIASTSLSLVTLPILLVARSRYPDPDSNLYGAIGVKAGVNSHLLVRSDGDHLLVPA